MARKTGSAKAAEKVDPVVAATLTGIIYQAKLFNRQARVNVPEEEVVVEVISLWRIVTEALNSGTLPGIRTSHVDGVRQRPPLGFGPSRQIQDEILHPVVVPVCGADHLFCQPPPAIQDVGFGELNSAIARRERAVRIPPDGIGDVILLNEIL